MRLHKAVFRCLLGFGVAVCALLSGCKGGLGRVTEDYGVPPPPSHPTVELTDFSYSPSAPIHAGDTLTLMATTNLPVANASVRAEVLPEGGWLPLKDDGQSPDSTAQDGIWTALYTLPATMQPTMDAYFFAVLDFDDFYWQQTRTTAKFEVLPAEEE